MSNRRYTQFFYTLRHRPTLLDCTFIVNPADAAGLGITSGSLKGPGISNVFMHTTQTPGSANGYLNPNPAVGSILVQLQDNYAGMLSFDSGIYSPNSGTPLTATVAHTAYVITALGTATAAQWLAVGLPAGQVAQIGSAFVATASGTIGGAAAVQAPSVSSIASIEAVGLPSMTLSSSGNSIFGQGSGAYVLFQALGPTSSGSTVPIPEQPATGTTISLTLYLSNYGQGF
jgi:hypothetical protein